MNEPDEKGYDVVLDLGQITFPGKRAWGHCQVSYIVYIHNVVEIKLTRAVITSAVEVQIT
jgi:hypothetical protein